MHADGVQHAEMDEPRFFHARHDFDVELGGFANFLEEFTAILRLAHRARRDRAHLGFVRLGDGGQSREALHAPLHRLLGDLFHVAAAVAESHHFLLAGDHLESAGHGLGDHQMKTVRADVQRRHEVAHSL